VGRLAKALVKKAPERMLWAPTGRIRRCRRSSARRTRTCSTYARLGAERTDRRKMLVDNPVELYGLLRVAIVGLGMA
jgi:hypothetical protein